MQAEPGETTQTDVAVIGGTPAGVAAAIAAARAGLDVVLVEASRHLGGLMTSGLGATDIRPNESVGGIFRRFVGMVREHYASTYGEDSEQVRDCNGGYRFEPSVAERLLEALVGDQKRLEVWRGWRLAWEGGASIPEDGRWLVETEPGADVTRIDETPERRVSAVTLAAVDERGAATGERVRLEARVFVDATYEGDVALGAGAAYRIGREGREELGESHAGVVYQEFHDRLTYPGSTGAADRRIQAYNYRLCLTDDPANRREVERPADYDRSVFARLVDDVRSGRMPGFWGPRGGTAVLNFVPMPNRKSDANNHHYCFTSSDWAEANFDYPEAGPERRLEIAGAHRAYTEGLVWFCQNDEELPAKFRDAAQAWGLAADEFQDNGGFPRQMYVREGCRILGGYLFSAGDALLDSSGGRSPTHWDSVASGGYQIDSHATRQREDLGLAAAPDRNVPDGRRMALEGFIGLHEETVPYQIPFRVMVPEGIDGLLVPVAVSASHLGYGTIRMEPVWMALGEAAGTAATLALERGTRVRDVPRGALQRELLAGGHVITYFEDVAPSGFSGYEQQAAGLWEAAQFWGARGFFSHYAARLNDPLTAGDAERWAWLARRAVDPWRPLEVDAGLFVDQTVCSWSSFADIVRSWMAEPSPLRASMGGLPDVPERARPDVTISRGDACRLIDRLYGGLV
ncbi:MAG: FAD-dependent oxidoreductase [Chloroflexi bacterium]|nr:FAD-dependent oxidoreductase [Chloroflexota bacterium]